MQNYKEKNRVPLAALMGAPLLLILVMQVGLADTRESIDYVAASGTALVVTSVLVMLSDLFPQALKHKLVFLRFKNELPGHRCNKICSAEPRLDAVQLKSDWPHVFGTQVSTSERNGLWYKHIYKPVMNEPQVESAHLKFLLYRDATAGSAVILILLAIWTWSGFVVPYIGLAHPWALEIELCFVAVQLLAAQSYGKRLVVNATVTRTS